MKLKSWFQFFFFFKERLLRECSHWQLSTWNWSEQSGELFTAFVIHTALSFCWPSVPWLLSTRIWTMWWAPLLEEMIIKRVQQEVTSHGLFIPGNEEARINKLFAAPRRAQRSRWPSLGCVHCSGERVGVTSHLFLRATGCPAETAPVSLFSYYSPTLTRTKINWTAHKGLVTQRAADE